MSDLSKALTGALGKSWKTSAAGYGQLLVVTIWTGYQGANGQLTSEGWIQLIGSAIIAVALRMAKDHDVSHAPAPGDPTSVASVTPP
jgi:hypothetical protein